MTSGPKKTLNNQLLNVCTTDETTNKLKSWDDYNIQEKLKAILLQRFLFWEGRGANEVYYQRFANGDCAKPNITLQEKP